MLDERLAYAKYLVDDQFSIADIALYAYVDRAAYGGFDGKTTEANTLRDARPENIVTLDPHLTSATVL